MSWLRALTSSRPLFLSIVLAIITGVFAFLLLNRSSHPALPHPAAAYLAPSDGRPDIWAINPDNSQSPIALTQTDTIIFDFAPDPKGRYIAFSERDSHTGVLDIKLLDISTGQSRLLLDCVNVECMSPVWHPDGSQLLYERIDPQIPLPAAGIDPRQLWLLDLTTTPPTTRPFFERRPPWSYGAQWSADGKHLLYYDTNAPGIFVYNTELQTAQFVAQGDGLAGAISPDGRYVAYTEFRRGDHHQGTQSHTILRLMDLSTNTITDLTDETTDLTDDTAPVWSPDGRYIAFLRRYLDERATAGNMIYLVDIETRQVRPVVSDGRYTHGALSWDRVGQRLLFQQVIREPQTNSLANPEIWSYNFQTGQLQELAKNAFAPRWIP